ncbi:hypothetical protein E1264_17745 [Actinomadura sp. KC216]|uniref:helix-turn-helix domain-containing protein n=1 Tax=Actinomadura sp. KC216 TaxID=2530370 RepID=UPI001048E0D7|nr:helix-turn-helix domain-containing protein [Actinomadura sp. KC216]TDB86442.1 hypothetical protein E1264_17745 [Actinomadura sp. KC216]
MSRTVELSPRQRELLADAVATRRDELGVTQAELSAQNGGRPSLATIGLIERGDRASVRRGVLRDLEDALRWERGSVEAVIAGRDPTPIGRQEPAPESNSEPWTILASLTELPEGARYPEIVGDDKFFQTIWDSPDAPEDDRVYAIIAVTSHRLKKSRHRGGARAAAAPSSRKEMDRA